MIDLRCLLAVATLFVGSCCAEKCGKFDPDKEGGNWPWAVHVYGDEEWRCIGTLVAKDRIITAARCVDPEEFPTKNWKVGLADGTETAVDKVFMHEEYVKNIDKSSDIAILTLKDEVTPTDTLMPVCAQDKGKEEQMTDCRTVSIIPDIDNTAGGERENIKAKNVAQKSCKEKTYQGDYLKAKSMKDLLCVNIDRKADDGQKGCSRMNVSPLYCNEEKKWYLSGISLSCGDKVYPTAKGEYAWYVDVCNCMDDMIPSSDKKEEEEESSGADEEEADDIEPTKSIKEKKEENKETKKEENKENNMEEKKKKKKEGNKEKKKEESKDKKKDAKKEKEKKKENKKKKTEKKKKEDKRKEEMKKMGWSKKKGDKKESKST